MEQISCDHCGKSLTTEDIGTMYSIKVDKLGFSALIVRGLLQDVLHYCSDNCMFNRRDGMIDPINYR